MENNNTVQPPLKQKTKTQYQHDKNTVQPQLKHKSKTQYKRNKNTMQTGRQGPQGGGLCLESVVAAGPGRSHCSASPTPLISPQLFSSPRLPLYSALPLLPSF
ncbi:unnamed protein product [Arctogadus glacialis]